MVRNQLPTVNITHLKMVVEGTLVCHGRLQQCLHHHVQAEQVAAQGRRLGARRAVHLCGTPMSMVWAWLAAGLPHFTSSTGQNLVSLPVAALRPQPMH